MLGENYNLARIYGTDVFYRSHDNERLICMGSTSKYSNISYLYGCAMYFSQISRAICMTKSQQTPTILLQHFGMNGHLESYLYSICSEEKPGCLVVARPWETTFPSVLGVISSIIYLYFSWLFHGSLGSKGSY